MIFRAVQVEVKTGRETGKVESYRARGKQAAARKLLYTRRLKDARCRLGPTGLVATCADGTAWVITRRGR
jgi:hypothetical protein